MAVLARERRAAQPGCVLLGRDWLAGSLPCPALGAEDGRELGNHCRELRMKAGERTGLLLHKGRKSSRKIPFTAHKNLFFLTEYLVIKLISWIDVSQSKLRNWQIH